MQQIAKYRTAIELIILLGLFLAAFLVDIEKARFRRDESMWINQSSHLEDFFTGNISAFQNQDENLALTMPTIPEYLIGVSRKLGGYTPKRLNKIWDWNKTDEQNKAEGRTPSRALLGWSRVLPSLLSIVSILITFYLVKSAFGTRTSYIWIILTLVNSWLIFALQGAMGESPLLFCIVMTMLAGFWAIKSFQPDRLRYSLLWLLVFGIFTGLAGQAKNNGVAVLGAGVIILILLTIRCPAPARWRFLLGGLAGMGLGSVIFFVGTNPYLWDDPIGKTIHIVKYRVELMHGAQAKAYPQIVIHSFGEGIQILITQVFKNLTSVQFINAEYLKMVLTVIGFILLIAKTWKPITSKITLSNPAVISIFLVGVFASIPSLFTPLNIDRYFMLPAYFVSILIALGFDWLLQYLLNLKPNTAVPSTSQTQAEA